MEYLVYIKTKNTKFTLALLSGIMYTLGQGVLLGSCGIYVYILSYIHYKYDWVDLPYGNLMMPLMIFCMSLFAPLSGTLDKIYGPYISILISSIIVEICFFAFYLQRSIWAFYIITLISGFGIFCLICNRYLARQDSFILGFLILIISYLSRDIFKKHKIKHWAFRYLIIYLFFIYIFTFYFIIYRFFLSKS